MAAFNFPFSDMSVIMESKGQSVCKQGDVFCYYRDNYLQQLRFYVAPPPATRTFGSIHTVIGHIVDNLPLVTSIRIRPKILWRNFRRSVTDLDYLVISYRFHHFNQSYRVICIWRIYALCQL